LLSSSNNNNVSGNQMNYNQEGIRIDVSSGNSISGNTIANGEAAITLYSSSDNLITENDVTSHQYGIALTSSSDNSIFHNSFVSNTNQVFSSDSSNAWDDGYPSGGNYWSDYQNSYPDAEEIDDSGIWNTPYVIDDDNSDNYPLMNR
jgi:parallel beta-helix repeat protein